MNYPNVTLKVANEVPVIEMHPNKDESYRLATGDMGFDTLYLKATEMLEMDQADIEQHADELRSADEFYLEFPEVDLDTDEIKLSELLKVVQEEIDKGMPYGEMKASELSDELKHNWHLDILASLQEAAYNLVIVRTVLIGSDLGIGRVTLDDSRKDTRLMEKMSKDLSQVGVELEVV